MPDENVAADNASAETQVSDIVDAHSDGDADAETGSGEHAAPEGAPLHPLIDLSRDPTPGKPDHARPEKE